ncbi:hypothetical protein QA600_18640 [Natronococcus sp. A-GB1]|uniref:Cdc6/Cdc18 family protein n=1 Tax=Natronococcus sp. A-GB1 TaxID=3037648 RepID=UPI00241CD149|nr:AAA family ATPase [Natronococcus sp. A-GB1]MDG5761352.1 hypothetical protein [Natronococcus sp. A-GB1]
MTTDHDVSFDPGIRPSTIAHRSDVQTVLQHAVMPPRQHLYLSGPRGTGKTLLVQDALPACTAPTYYLSCRRYDTQYKVLNRLYTAITDDDLNPGYHTAHLQRRLADVLPGTLLVVLDDLAFLLENNGNDLLYFLSRLDQTELYLVGISAVHPTLETVLDERTYSTFRPHHLPVPPYTEPQAADILGDRVDTVCGPDAVTTEALTYLTETTTNLSLALHWLQCATHRDTPVTADTLHTVRTDALHRYWDDLLADFTWHHHALLTTIEDTTAGSTTVTTGTVYTRYTEYCHEHRIDPLTIRRINDYLVHLELLNLIQVTYYYGGTHGKTRELNLTPLQEL